MPKPESNWRSIPLIAERVLSLASLSADVKQNFRTRSGGTILIRSHCKQGGITRHRAASGLFPASAVVSFRNCICGALAAWLGRVVNCEAPQTDDTADVAAPDSPGRARPNWPRY